MVCSPDDLVVWKDFPKGLRILLLEHDGSSAAETKLKLEGMDYIVSLFCNEEDALEAVSKRDESFHVAIIEVTSGSRSCTFRFLEMARDLPTIVISTIQCLNTMMKCIALGAAEFLQKPISDDKLRNIWQHVVHKAFNAGENVLSKSLKPIRETVVSLLQLQSDLAQPKINFTSEAEKNDEENQHNDAVVKDKFPAPSTSQLGHGESVLDDGDCQAQLGCSTKNENTSNANDSCQVRNSGSSESNNTSNNLICSITSDKVSPSENGEASAEQEVDSADGVKTDEGNAAKRGPMPSHMYKQGHVDSTAEDLKKQKSIPCSSSFSRANNGSRKKIKVDWTPELHKRFVQAVEHLGVDQAIPSKILELMKVEKLTRHNVASHLQKYRMHRRYILPKEDDRRWKQHGDPLPKGYMQKPQVAIPPYHSSCGFLPNPVYPVWGHPIYHSSSIQMWSHASYTMWPPRPENWLWRTYPGIHADAWGCPVVPAYGQSPISSLSPSVGSCMDVSEDINRVSEDSYGHMAEEAIDKIVKEAMSKPWLPLPLGLKPPSTDSVLAVLHRQGIRNILPPHCPSHR